MFNEGLINLGAVGMSSDVDLSPSREKGGRQHRVLARASNKPWKTYCYEKNNCLSRSGNRISSRGYLCRGTDFVEASRCASSTTARILLTQ